MGHLNNTDTQRVLGSKHAVVDLCVCTDVQSQ